VTGTLQERAEADLERDDREFDRLEAMVSFTGSATAAPEPGESPSDALRSLLTPWTDEELADAKTPWPHVFQDRHVGMFPEGEVSIIAAAGREGKTTVKIGIATAIVIGHSLADLLPLPNRSVIVYSAEDDRAQYARKVAAQISLLSPQQGQWVKERLVVPNLDDLGHDAAKSLVAVFDGQPMVSGAVETIIEAIRPLMEGPCPPGLLIFETASTLSEAEENNAGFRLLILALRRIARTLRVAVVLSHHVSQASLSNLSDLNLSTADIRGATALVNNSRQTAMLVNLGCDEDPFPDADARTVLRRMAAPGLNERITALITLDSSKGIPPPPVFFRWVNTDWGPAAVEVDPPARLIGKPWRKVHEMVRAERASVRDEAKAGARNASVAQVVALVRTLERAGKQPTARAVSVAAGKSPGWAAPYLEAACDLGDLSCAVESIPRMKGGTKVYRSVHLSEVSA